MRLNELTEVEELASPGVWFDSIVAVGMQRLGNSDRWHRSNGLCFIGYTIFRCTVRYTGRPIDNINSYRTPFPARLADVSHDALPNGSLRFPLPQLAWMRHIDESDSVHIFGCILWNCHDSL